MNINVRNILPPVDLRAVCLVRALLKKDLKKKRNKWGEVQKI